MSSIGSGFLQAALDGEAFNQDLRRRVVDVATLVRIRNKGYVLLADEDGTILSAPAALQSEIGGSLEEFLGMSKEEIRAVSQAFRSEYIQNNADTLWPMVCDDMEHLLFYLSRYGRDGVRRLRLRDTTTAQDLYKKYLI